MRYSILTLLLINCILLFAQPDLAPLSGPAPQSFALNPDKLGAVSSSVNLFTGDLTFPITLASVPGRNGLDMGISIAYSSNVHRQANSWNVEAPTGVVGLGWSFDYPKILVDNKMTGTREDDTYYISEGGASNELVYIGVSGGIKEYKPKSHQFWIIKYDPVNDKWDIIKEDGSKFIYGDRNSGRSTIQWTVTWNNWIGSSHITTSTVQKQQALVWNLSEIKNIWGEKLLFSYLNINQKVGSSSGKEHTEASYLSTVTDVLGRTINLVYADKTYSEYVEPNTYYGRNVVDAYQERYEMKYLDYINVNDSDGSLLNKVDLTYTTMGTGDMTKRLLTSIVGYNSANQSLPGYVFSYTTTNLFTNFGALVSITTPTGGVLNYTYANQSITRAVREKKIVEIPGYAEPKVWIGPDYVLVTRRELNSGSHTTAPKTVKIQVFNWDGEWLEWNLSNEIMADIKVVDDVDNDDFAELDNTVPDYQKFMVTMQKDFFAIAYRYNGASSNTIRIYRKDPKTRNSWTRDSFTDVNSDVLLRINYRIVSGEKFVAFANKNGDINVYQWNGTQWLSSSLIRSDTHNPIVAGHNYIISHKRGSPDLIRFYFLKEDGSWIEKDAPSLPDSYTVDKSYWHAGSSFAVAMADDNNEYIYSWDENYNILTPYNTGLQIPDNSYVDITNNSMVGILTTDGTPVGYSFRYNGQSWSAGGSMDYSGILLEARSLQSYGDDFIVRPRPSGKIGLRTYNANTAAWSNSDYSTANRYLLFAGYTYFVAVDATENTKARIYMKKPNGSFLLDPIGMNTLNSGEVRFGWQGGYDYVIKSYSDATGWLQSIKFKNGKINADASELDRSYVDGSNLISITDDSPVIHEVEYFDPTRIMASGNTLVTFLSHDGTILQSNAKEVRLHRMIDTEAIGFLKDFPVQKVSVNDGEKTTYSYISYNTATATYDASGTICQYNKVSVYPGVQWADNSNGHSEFYFHNGLTSAEAVAAGSTFPSSSHITGASVSYDPYLRLLTGTPYRTKVVNSISTVVSETASTPSFFTKEIRRSSVVVDNAWYVRPYTNEQTIDNKSSYSYQSYNLAVYDKNGLPITKTSFSEGDDNLNPVVENYKYWYEEYDPTLSKNILSPVIQNKRTVQGIVTDCAAIKYKNWGINTVPAPYQVYSWKRTGSSDFTAWTTASVPSTDWRLMNTVDAMDESKGLVTQTTGMDGVISKTVWNTSGKHVMAQITSPSAGTIIYNGFEDCTSNCSTEAKTGLISSSGASVSYSGLPSNTYKVTYWRKPSAVADWELIESTFTGTSYTVPDTWIDELRIYPANTEIVSYGYDRYGNVISECDVNNMIIYKEYDEFQRPKLIRDKDRNIITQTLYHLKN